MRDQLGWPGYLIPCNPFALVKLNKEKMAQVCGATKLCVFFFFSSTVYICVLILGQGLHLVSEPGVLLGKSRRRQQGGDGHGAEAIAVRSSSSMSEPSTRCVIDGNMEAGHRRVAAPVMNMCESSTRYVIGGNMKASHRRVAALVVNMRQRACHGGTLVVNA